MKQLMLIALVLGFISCGGPEPRRPVKVKSGSLNSSVERNKKLLALEEGIIQKIIESDSLHQYLNSNTGTRYYYDIAIEGITNTPVPDDLVTMSYNVVTFTNDTLYSMQDIGVFKYKVDKQELFPGLRNSVKLLKEGESATFLFPSSLAYGYHGDENKIGINVPFKSTISLFKIEKQVDSIQN